MRYLLKVALHHVIVSRLDKDLFTVSDRLKQLFIILFFLYDGLFDGKFLPLFSDLLLVNIIHFELALFLFNH